MRCRIKYNYNSKGYNYPILASLYDLFGVGNAIPITILSIPINRSTIETKRIIVAVVILGYVRVTTIKIMAIEPKPSSTGRNQLGNLLLSLSSC
jgi:hypothetical protein